MIVLGLAQLSIAGRSSIKYQGSIIYGLWLIIVMLEIQFACEGFTAKEAYKGSGGYTTA